MSTYVHGATDTTEPEFPVTFRVPPAFHEIPLIDDVDILVEELRFLAIEVYPEGSNELWFAYVAMQLQAVEDMLAAGVSYAGFCILDIEGQRSTASVTASLIDGGPQVRAVNCKELAAQLAEESPQSEVETVKLAAGEAAVRITPEAVDLPADMTDSGRPESLTIGKIAVFFPIPGQRQVCLFELSTPCMDDWNLYSELFFNIVNTIEVTGAPGNGSASLPVHDGAVPPAAVPPVVVPEKAAPQPPTLELTKKLYWHSSRLLDALALRGRMEQNAQPFTVTCDACTAKGLHSSCSAQHDWRIEEIDPASLPAAVQRLRAYLSGGGWSVEASAGETARPLRAAAGADAPSEIAGYSVSVTEYVAERRLEVRLASPCVRSAPAPEGSTFG
ncbi:hypothetical protein [Streptomyces chrestomyceticus]|uniref:Uncharacterized protein n=1 Tax=Streptomyces chrestomyceticus TaxID=68185 RepID=A0ABU7WMH2_9ACTN